MAMRDWGWIAPEGLRRVKSALALLISVAVLLGAAGFVAWKGYSFYMDYKQKDDYIGEGDQPVQIVIPEQAGVGKIADICVANDVIRDPVIFEDYMAENHENDYIQAGTYNIKTHLPAATAAEMLLDGSNRVVFTVTIPEGSRWSAIVPIMVGKGTTEDKINEVLAAVQADPTIIGLNPAAGTNPEGFLFPDTYQISNPVNPQSLMTQMAAQFTKVSGEIGLEGGAAALGYTPQQIVTVASIIEAEVFNEDDRPKVARVIYNRLAQGMMLQVDSSVSYGLGKSGHANLALGDISIDTPYNTYMHQGLPPTPIDNPGREALIAALNPAEGGWLYWTTVNLSTGQTEFESTIDEHNAHVAQYQQWCNANPGACS